METDGRPLSIQIHCNIRVLLPVAVKLVGDGDALVVIHPEVLSVVDVASADGDAQGDGRGRGEGGAAGGLDERGRAADDMVGMLGPKY